MKNSQLFCLFALLFSLCLFLSACGKSADLSESAKNSTETPILTESPLPTETTMPTSTVFPKAMDAQAALDVVLGICPLEKIHLQNISTMQRPDKSWVITFDSPFGEFMYVVDSSTGEIIDREEPELNKADIESLLSSKEALAIAKTASGEDPVLMKKETVSWNQNICTVTFSTDRGDYLYKLDGTTGEILEREEPDMETEQTSKRAVPTGRDALDIVYSIAPIDQKMMKKISVTKTVDDVWMVSFQSDYGSFLYGIDSITGEIVEREEPDMTADVQVMLTSGQALDKVYAVCPIKSSEMKNILVSKKANDTYIITFDADNGSYMYEVDGYTGEILNREEP